MTVERTANRSRDADARVTDRDAPVTNRDDRRVLAAGWAGVYRDRVSWAGVWGGLLTTLGLFVLLSMLATAIGITTVRQTDADPGQISRIAGLATAALALVSFFIGGFVAGHGGGIVGRNAGGLNGFLVWALALVVLLLLAAMGLGQLFGAIGAAFDSFRQLATVQLGTVEVDRDAITSGLQTGAWITFISLGLAATAATLGGLLGAIADEA